MFRFSILACWSLFIYDSSLSSYQTNFSPVYSKSFNSVMSFVGLFVNKSFTFSVSDLTVFQFGFLREGNVVFFSGMINLMVSTFFFSSWINFYVCVFLVYRSLSCSVWLGVSGFPVFSVSVTVLGVCWCVWLCICWWISIISRSENQPFFVIVLTWSASLWFVALNLPNSVQISIILFLYPLFVRFASKITV